MILNSYLIESFVESNQYEFIYVNIIFLAYKEKSFFVGFDFLTKKCSNSIATNDKGILQKRKGHDKIDSVNVCCIHCSCLFEHLYAKPLDSVFGRFHLMCYSDEKSIPDYSRV